jgi:hypothetical protein
MVILQNAVSPGRCRRDVENKHSGGKKDSKNTYMKKESWRKS